MKRFTLILSLLVAMVTTAMAGDIVASTNEASPEKIFTMVSGNNASVGADAAPGDGRFAFFAVENVENAYYIYSVTNNKWFSYAKAGSYSNGTNFVTLSDTKENYFHFEKLSNGYYQIRPYNNTGVAAKYLNYYGGASAGVKLGLWQDNGTFDAGSRYLIEEYVVIPYVTSPADITSTALYTIAPNDAGRGVLYANSTSTHLTTTGLANQDINDVNQQFMFITKDEKTYLYSVGANKFVNDEGKYLNLTAAAKDYVVVESADVDGHLFIKMNGCDLINVSTGWTYGALADWNDADNGNRLRVRYVAEASEDLLAAIDELFNSTAEVTYNFICNGVTLATQTATVSKGSEYPAFNVTLPLGYEIVEQKPEGTVTATSTEEITVVVNNELLPFEAVAEGTPTTWYYAQMHAYGGYHWFVAPAEDGSSVRTQDHEFAADEVDAHLWGFVGTVEGGFKMVNKATSKAIKSTNGGVAAMAEVADATAFAVMTSPTNGWFCLRHPEGNYLNAQGSDAGEGTCDFVIKHWSANDNGSSFFLTEYVNEDVTVNVSEAGWATKYFAESVHVPAGVNAYIVTGAENGYVTKEQIAAGGVIPANTGILLENAGEHKFAKTVSYNYTLAGNLLNGSVENTYVEGIAYVLANHAEAGIGFYKAELNMDADGNKVGVETGTHFLNNAGKAYLVLPTANETVAFYGLDWDGTTGIEKVEVENGVKAIFDLTGRRIEAITAPGIYIVNGKKVLVK